jgi:hypothetical protein
MPTVVPETQATFFRRRHQPRTPPLAKIRPGSPAPATGPGTAPGIHFQKKPVFRVGSLGQ